MDWSLLFFGFSAILFLIFIIFLLVFIVFVIIKKKNSFVQKALIGSFALSILCLVISFSIYMVNEHEANVENKPVEDNAAVSNEAIEESETEEAISNFPLQYISDGKLLVSKGDILSADEGAVTYVTNDSSIGMIGYYFYSEKVSDIVSSWKGIKYVGGSADYIAAIDKNNVAHVLKRGGGKEEAPKTYTDVKDIKFSKQNGIIVYLDGTVQVINVFDEEDFTKERIEEINAWTNIEKVDFTEHATYPDAKVPNVIGLKEDGTITYLSELGEEYDFSMFTDLVDVETGHRSIYGLRSDGTVVKAEKKDSDRKDEIDVSSWNKVCMIAAGRGFVVGLKEDGTLYYSGNDTSIKSECVLWNDIVAIEARNGIIYGISDDGKLISIGSAGQEYGPSVVLTYSNGTVIPSGIQEIASCENIALPSNVRLQNDNPQYPIGFTGPSLESLIRKADNDSHCSFNGCTNTAKCYISGLTDSPDFCSEHIYRVIPSSISLESIDLPKLGHLCSVKNCLEEASYSVEGLNGEIEYYCADHYQEMVDILNSFQQQ